jgi:glycosyltransferase involved in cell wall biosynthesis
MGFLEPDDLADLYANADICVLPSMTETCGLVALEAMASGLPVVAADAGGFRESVRDRENGLLVNPLEPHAFASGILEFALDPGLRLSIGRHARRTAESRDVREENAVLLAQYRRIAGSTVQGRAWSAA